MHSLHADNESLLKDADAIAEITLCSPMALQNIKKVVMRHRHLPVEESYRIGDPMMDQFTRTEDSLEATRAFAERRRPVWKMK
ncbi:hypothetical protein IVB09_40600 [Bradyrhizobium sp. 174]|nr:hypothetical protein [Bradyrhizobium sp. 174]